MKSLLAVPLLLAFAGCASNPLAKARYWNLDQCIRSTTPEVTFNRMDGSTASLPRATCERMAAAAGKIQIAASYSVANLYLADATQVNAFATKDKQGAPIIVVTLPMATALGTDEAAWAGLLGHETAHLVQRHAEARRRAQAGAYGAGQAVATGLGFLIPGVGGLIGGTVGGTLAQNAVYGAYTRPQESEADDLGLKWLIAAGYDPRGMERLFDLLGRQSSLPAFISTHPAPDDRAAKIRELLDAQARQGEAAR
jgi:predicted Zn-dependent protease